MNLKHIFEGWAKSLKLAEVTPENELLAINRVKICIGYETGKSCEFAKEMWLKKFIDGMLKRDKLGSGIGCGKCGCPLNEKVLVIEERCPVDKW